jgi:hypothetical protein
MTLCFLRKYRALLIVTVVTVTAITIGMLQISYFRTMAIPVFNSLTRYSKDS